MDVHHVAFVKDSFRMSLFPFLLIVLLSAGHFLIQSQLLDLTFPQNMPDLFFRSSLTFIKNIIHLISFDDTLESGNDTYERQCIFF